VNLLGPPYRWLLPDCECFYTENLYVKTAAEQKIDAYFTLASLTTCDDEFWKANGDKPLDTFTSAAKADILTQVRNESKRRLELPGVYRDNANDIARKRSQNQWAPIDPSLYEPFSPVINGDEPPDLAPGLPASEVFTPEWLQAWKCVKQGGDPRLLHVHNECFEIPLFTDVFVSKLVAEITHFKGQGLPHQWPNNMNRAGLILNEIGMGPFMDRLIEHYLGPVSAALYPRLLGEGFEAHHSFIVSYSMETDRTLGVHDDNSEVTINIALSDRYTGAKLALYQHARSAHPQQIAQEKYEWRVDRAGNMLLHPGEMLHEVLPLESGDRMGMIIWLRSNTWRGANGCPLCQSQERLMYENGPDQKEQRRIGIEDSKQ